MSKAKLSTTNIVTCALYVLIGVALCIWRSGVLNILMTVVGALCILYGAIELFNGHVTPGVIAIAIGIVLIVCGWTIATYVLLVIGILLLVKGVIDMINLIKKKGSNAMAWVNVVVTIALGIVLCVSPFAITDILILVIGIVFIIDGVLALFGKKLSSK